MWLDDKQIALNELIVAYREAADHFTDASDHLDDEGLRSLFDDIRTGHTQAADGLSDAVRKTGTLPRAQHADREQLHQIVTHVKAAFADDGVQVFLEDRIEHEKEIARLITEGLKVSLPADTQASLEDLQTREQDVLSMLDKALANRTT